MKKLLFLFLFMMPAIAMADSDVPFILSGLQEGDHVMVTMSSESYLATLDINSDGDYAFSTVPVGKHYIKVEASGYALPDSKAVYVNSDGNIEPRSGIQLVITKIDEEDVWQHSWHEDGSIAGYTTTSHVNQPAELVYLGKKIVPSDVPSKSILETDYGMVLSNNGETWTQEYAYRLLETMKTFPNGIQGDDITVIQLTKEPIADDVLIETVDGGKLVTLATDAFVYANPFLVTLDGVRGRFFSKRLHYAIVNLLTDYGNNSDRVNMILTERFGCSIFPPSYEELTASTTNEDAARFQDFFPDELVNIINMFEEMPEGFHKVSHLNYLIRRRNGHKNPLYPDAAAVTFPIEVGYIEFMESAFTGKVLRDGVNRLILHEKTHMLWAFVFSENIKNDWITLGGWYQNPNLSDAWMTTQDTEFVSAYAHGVNPDEDMAESVAAYICEPEKLMSRANSKYEFIRDRIMHGTRYMSHIREDLTFEVLNLYPDYDYPGKIKSLDLKVEGKPEEDKLVTVDITLNHIDGVEDGASGGWVRLASPLFMTVEGIPMLHNADIGFSPVDGDPWHLRGEVVISKYSKSGYWTPGDIVLSDQVGNSRFAGNNDYVWNMYVNNPLEDIEMPKYISGSLEYNLTDTIVEGHKAQWLEVSYKLTDNIGIKSTRFNLYHSHAGGQFGGDAVYDENTHIAKGGTLITEFFRTGNYYVSAIDLGDYADNSMSVEFSESPKDEPIKYIYVETANPDTEAPEIDLNRIMVYAEPVNKEAPDGETLVTITYFARDDKSGLDGVGFALLDPQGLLHPFEYSGVIHRNSGTIYFDGDPTVWEKYTAHAVLPQGSAPGIWGLAEASISDKALNGKIYNFVETLIFEPDDSQEGYLLFAEMTDEEKLNLDLSALAEDTRGYSFVYRVVNEDTGQEISGTISLDEGAQNARARRQTSTIGNIIDVSSLSDGKLVVIVLIKDADNKVIAVRSKTLMKGHVSGNGDVNSNGTVDSSDVVEVVNALMGKASIYFNESNADANGDGIINTADIIVIVNKITQVE